LLAALVAVSVSGCHGHAKAPPQEQVAAMAAPEQPVAVDSPSTDLSATGDVRNDYLIGADDVLQITVFQEDDLKSTLRVSQQGTVVFPLIGMVGVRGLTPQQAAHAIEHRLSPGYLINPQVNVTVLEFAKRRFTVLGEVQRPGSYDMPDQQDMTVLQAIGMAGGYTRIANPSKVTLMRKTEERPEIFHLNARRMAGGDAQSAFPVMPGDVITVAQSRF
jgi:protein involved in polysaccharide export with SLBB domain